MSQICHARPYFSFMVHHVILSRAEANAIIPPLQRIGNDYKGCMGRVAVIGGSKDYTGAPFYAAQSALKFGADLSTVFCSSSSSIPIKCYSPEVKYHQQPSNTII